MNQGASAFLPYLVGLLMVLTLPKMGTPQDINPPYYASSYHLGLWSINLSWSKRKLVISPQNRYGFPKVLLHGHKKKQREKPRSPGPHPRAPPMKAGSLFKCLVDSIYPELLFQLGIWLDATVKHQSTIFSVNKTEVPVQLTCSLNLAVMVQVMPSNVQVMCSQLLPPTWKVFNTTSQLLHIEHIWWLLPFTLCMNAPLLKTDSLWFLCESRRPHLASNLKGVLSLNQSSISNFNEQYQCHQASQMRNSERLPLSKSSLRSLFPPLKAYCTSIYPYLSASMFGSQFTMAALSN